MENDYLHFLKENFIKGIDRGVVYHTLPLNKIEQREIDFRKSPSSKEIQRSTYVKIDNNINKQHIMKHFGQMLKAEKKNIKKGNVFKAKNKYHMRNELENEVQNVSLKYCPYHDVQNKYQSFLNQKAQFLGKITKLRNNGKKLHNAHRIHRFVEIYSK